MTESNIISATNPKTIPAQFRNDNKYLLNMFSSIEASNFDTKEINIDTYSVKLSKSELSALVRKNGVLRRAVYEYPRTAAATWIHLNYGKATTEDPGDVLTYLRNIPWFITAMTSVANYGVRSAFEYASGLARKFGSAHIVLGVSDGLELSEPLDPSRMQSIDFMKVYDCWELPYIGGIDLAPLNGKLNPDNNKVRDYFNYYGVKIHPSRVLSFYGNKLDSQEEIVSSQYQHDSVIIAMFEAFNNWLVGNQAVSVLLQTSSMYSFGIDDLGNLIRQDIEQESTKNQEALSLRARSLKRGMNVSGLLLFDKTLEELSAVNRSLAGTKDSLDALKDFLASCTDLPRSILFNEIGGGGGLASTVQSAQILDFNWSKSVSFWARDNWLQPLDRMIKLAMQTRDLYGTVLDAYTEDSVVFPVSLQLSEKEQMELEKLAAERAKILSEIQTDEGVLTREEIRSQYLSAVFNSAITLDK